MRHLLDAYALVAVARDERGADDVEMLLRRGECAVPAVNLAEAVDVLGRREGRSAEQLRAVLEPLFDAVLDVLPVDEPMAWRAALLRGRHYHRSSSPLSLADCVLLAAAGTDDIVATADEPLVRAARAEDIGVVRLG